MTPDIPRTPARPRAAMSAVLLLAAALAAPAPLGADAARGDDAEPRQALRVLAPLVGWWAREQRAFLPDGRRFEERGTARHAFVLGARHMSLQGLDGSGRVSTLLLLSRDDASGRWTLTWLDDHTDVPSVSTGAWDEGDGALVLEGREHFPWADAETATRTTVRPVIGERPALLVEAQDGAGAWRTVLEVRFEPTGPSAPTEPPGTAEKDDARRPDR